MPRGTDPAADLAAELSRQTGRDILIGGAGVESGLLTEIQQLTVPVYLTYGMTETASHVALRRLNGEQLESFYLFSLALNGLAHHDPAWWSCPVSFPG